MTGTVLGCEVLAGNRIEPSVEALRFRFLLWYCTTTGELPSHILLQGIKADPPQNGPGKQLQALGPHPPTSYLLELRRQISPPTSPGSRPGYSSVLRVISGKSLPFSAPPVTPLGFC